MNAADANELYNALAAGDPAPQRKQIMQQAVSKALEKSILAPSDTYAKKLTAWAYGLDAGDGTKSHPYRPYVRSVSGDGGRTWSRAVSLGESVGCARPRLLALGGSLLLACRSGAVGRKALDRLRSAASGAPVRWLRSGGVLMDERRARSLSSCSSSFLLDGVAIRVRKRAFG